MMGSKYPNKKDKDNLKLDRSPSTHGSDPRLLWMQTNPRFQEAPKHQTKVVVGSRFHSMFTKNSAFSSSTSVDKRGKRINRSQLDSLCRYYKINAEEVDHGRIEDDEEEESSDSEYAIDTDEGAHEEEALDMQEMITKVKKETYRLAVVNMDWRYVKAVDLYVLLSSFVPLNGLIKSVAIYPTDFGLQRMKEEEVHGPVGLFNIDENEKGDEDSSDDDIDNEKLRAYEKSRMRYYYAVVECDSSTTADCIYENCDGQEFLHSSNSLDLRFIPNNMEFLHPPRDVATEAPANYECKDFYSRALQHSTVNNLSWDEDEPLRAQTLKQKFNDKQLAQLELKEFLASESGSDSEYNDETDDQSDQKTKNRDMYRALLLSGNGSDGDGEYEDLQDMEVTFNPALEEISKYIMEKKDKKLETVWKACQRERQEKKKANKNKSKYSSDDDNIDQEANDFFIEEPAVKRRKKAQSKKDTSHELQDLDGVDKASKEELDLLLVDDKGTDTGLKGYKLKFKENKGKKRKNVIDEGKIPNPYDDSRFSPFRHSSDYAIDPTHPEFVRSAPYARQLAQKQRKCHTELSREREQMKLPKGTQLSSNDCRMQRDGEEGLDALKSKKEKDNKLSSLVNLIKMKLKRVYPQMERQGKSKKLKFRGMEKRRH